MINDHLHLCPLKIRWAGDEPYYSHVSPESDTASCPGCSRPTPDGETPPSSRNESIPSWLSADATLLLRYFPEDVQRVEHTPWLPELCAHHLDNASIATAFRAAQVEGPNVSSNDVRTMVRRAVCVCAKSRSWTAAEIDEQQVVRKWRSMRAQRQQQALTSEQIFPRTGEEHHSLRLFHHCILALWEHECRDYDGTNDVNTTLAEMAGQYGAATPSQVNEVLFCAYPVRWKLAELATWMEKHFDDRVDDMKLVIRMFHNVAEPIIQKSKWRTKMVNKSLKALNLPLTDMEEPARPDAANTQISSGHAIASGTRMPVLPRYLRDNILQVLLYHPLELHKPEVLRVVAAYASNSILCRARNMLHYLGYVQDEYSE